MPSISSKIVLTSAASSSNVVVADIELIKGAAYSVATTSSLSSISTNYLSDGQILFVRNEDSFYKLTITPANPPFTFIPSYAWNEVILSAGSTTDISALNLFTGSAQISLDALNAATSSYALKAEISGAFTSVSSSVSVRLTSLEAGGGSVPSGTISSSQQITNFGFISSSATIASEISGAFTSVSGGLAGRITTLEGTSGGSTDITALNLFTSSAQTSLTALNSATSSYLTSASTGSFILASQTSSMSVLSALTASFISSTFISASAAASGFGTATLPSGVLSASAQIAVEISGAFTEVSGGLAGRITTLETTSGGDVTALNTFTASIQTQVDSLIVKTGSYATTGSNTFIGTEIVSGSLNVSGSFVSNNLIYPTTDGGFESQVLKTNAAGTLSFGDVSTIYETIYNGEATPLVKGTPVYVSGSQGAAPKVYRADAGDSAKMPVTYIVSEEIASETEGRGIVLGLISGIDLTGYTAGQDVYVAVGGGWTSTRPTGNATVQFLGIVTKPGSGGQGLVLNPGAVALPNLNSGSIWVGGSNGVPTQILTSSLSVLSALTASFISDLFISASAVRSGFGTALFPSGLLSSSFQIANDISGAFTSLSSSFASRITALEGAGGGNGIFTLTGSFYSTTNNIQITGSLSVGSGSFKAFEVDSDGFVVLGDTDKDLNNAPEGTIAYSGSSFYLIT